MGRKHHRKKRYYSITDRPSFKIISSVLTVLVFAMLYYLIVILMENPGFALIVSVPCVLLLIWVAIKQRYFWWIWMLFASVCIVLMLVLQGGTMQFLLQTVYWIGSYAMCQWLIIASSKGKHLSKKRKAARHYHHHHSQEPSAPRPRDELLEQLFANVE